MLRAVSGRWLRIRVKQPSAVAFDCKRAKDACAVGTGVDRDTVRPLLHLAADRMAMNHHEAMVGFVEQEGLADPPHVRLSLLLQRNAGPDAGVDEEIVAEAAAIGEALQERDMLLGIALRTTASACSSLSWRDIFRIDAVAPQAFGTAEPSPLGDQLSLAAQNAEKHLLMVPKDENRPDPGAAVGAQPLDHLGGAGSTIDQVADEHQQGLGSRPVLQLGMNLREKVLEQVEAPMDVAHDICPAAGWTGGFACADEANIPSIKPPIVSASSSARTSR